MNYITTTELRTESKNLIEALMMGKSVKLIHRSKVVGQINPDEEIKKLNNKDLENIQTAAGKLNLPKMPYSQREKKFRDGLIKKYGQHLP